MIENKAFWRHIYTELRSQEKLIQAYGECRFWRSGTGACPREVFEEYTLNNAFWRQYTQLRSQAISQVIIIVQIKFTGIIFFLN